MTIENKLQTMILDRFGTISAFTKKTGIPNSTLVSIINRGVMNSNVTNIAKICHALGISIDALVDGEIIAASDIPRPESHDIKNQIDAICTDLIVRDDIVLNGQPLPPSRSADLADLLHLSIVHAQNLQ